MLKALCRRNKYGYCKHSDKCRFRHVNEKCVTPDCNVFDCERRHPKIFKFKGQYGRCKCTTYCKYDHDKPNNLIENNAKIAALDKKIENLQRNTKSQDNGNLHK